MYARIVSTEEDRISRERALKLALISGSRSQCSLKLGQCESKRSEHSRGLGMAVELAPYRLHDHTYL